MSSSRRSKGAPAASGATDKSPSHDASKRNSGDAASASSASSAGQRRSSGQDVVVVHGLTEDRKGLRVLRARREGIEMGEVRPVVEGQPITSDLVRLTPRPESPLICDVETEYAAPRSSTPPRKSVGPAQVATQAYRDNWDTIWANNPMTAPGSRELN